MVGCFIGYLWSSRSIRKRAEQDFIKMTSIQDAQYLKKELQWQQEYLKLYELFSELERELVERDYEEFKAPDVNNDERITRDEVSSHNTHTYNKYSLIYILPYSSSMTT